MSIHVNSSLESELNKAELSKRTNRNDFLMHIIAENGNHFNLLVGLSILWTKKENEKILDLDG